MIEEQGPGYDELELRASAFEQLGVLQEAFWDYERLIQLFPDRYLAYLRASNILLELKQYDLAIDVARTGLLRKTQDPQGDDLLNAALDAALVARYDSRKASLPVTATFISKLPYDILGHIFWQAINNYNVPDLNIMLVCREWEQVVKDMPTIWKPLVLDSSWVEISARVRAWMEKSHRRVADLRAQSLDGLTGWYEEYGSQSSRHLEHITFQFSANIPKKFYIEADPVSFIWRIRNPYGEGRKYPLKTTGRKAPFRLKELTLCGVTIDFQTIYDRLKDLTKLSIEGSEIQCVHLFPILQASPRIATLEVTMNHNEEPIATTRILLFMLKELRIGQGDHVIKCLEVPSLRKLTTSYMHLEQIFRDLMPEDLPLTSFGLKHAQSIEMSNCSLPPTLTSLSFAGCYAKPDDWVDRIAAGECPLLTHLDVSDTKVGPECLIRLVQARNPPTTTTAQPSSGSQFARLANLNLSGCGSFKPRFLPWFRTRVAIVIWTPVRYDRD
ncbi:hypothetical protein FRC18_001322 [Serendipita sp. 400]|nr:hypothetical protein FRC18_001322 [Serendipita sp. 400]